MKYVEFTNIECHTYELLQTIRANRTSRKGSRRGAARNAILGSPVARAKAASAIKPTPAPSANTAEKIMVSNLPRDVNELQIRVGLCRQLLDLDNSSFRICSFRLLVQSGRSLCTMMQTVSPKESLLCTSNQKATPPRRMSNTTIDSSIAVSIASPRPALVSSHHYSSGRPFTFHCVLGELRLPVSV